MTHEIRVPGLALYDDGPHDQVPLVLGHALGADHRIWDGVVEQLPGRRIIRWDLPGHGSSPVLSPPFTIEHLGQTLVDELDAIGVSDFHIGGISIGGMVALSIAQNFPDRVTSLAVLNAGPQQLPSSMWSERANVVRHEGTEPLVDGTMQRWFTEDFYLGAGADVCARIRESYLQVDREGFAQCCEVLATANLKPKLAEIRVPVLAVTGADDPGMTPEQLSDLAQALSGTQCRSLVIANCKHLTCVENPGEVATAIAQLIG